MIEQKTDFFEPEEWYPIPTRKTDKPKDLFPKLTPEEDILFDFNFVRRRICTSKDDFKWRIVTYILQETKRKSEQNGLEELFEREKREIDKLYMIEVESKDKA